jgi:hypothetical protein
MICRSGVAIKNGCAFLTNDRSITMLRRIAAPVLGSAVKLCTTGPQVGGYGKDHPSSGADWALDRLAGFQFLEVRHRAHARAEDRIPAHPERHLVLMSTR